MGRPYPNLRTLLSGLLKPLVYNNHYAPFAKSEWASGVNEEIKFAAARAIAFTIKDDELSENYIIPSIFDKKVVLSVAHAVAEKAKETGIAS